MTVCRFLGFSNCFIIDGKAPGYSFCGSGSPISSLLRYLSKKCSEHTRFACHVWILPFDSNNPGFFSNSYALEFNKNVIFLSFAFSVSVSAIYSCACSEPFQDFSRRMNAVYPDALCIGTPHRHH